MARLVWDEASDRAYETGVDHVVLYKKDSSGAYTLATAWNGVTAITESPSGAEANPFYADNIKYLNLISAEDFGCTIEAYSAPDAFDTCDGWKVPVAGVRVGQQPREEFALAFRTKVITGGVAAYEIHVVYGCMASPSEKSYETINDSPSPITFSWEITTTPVKVSGKKDAAHLTILPSYTNYAAVEAKLFGTTTANAQLPLPDALAALT